MASIIGGLPMSIASILSRKGRHVISVAPEETVAAIAQVLAENRIGAVLVQNGRGQVLGIVSERDIVRVVASTGAEALDGTAESLMTRELATVVQNTTAVEALSLMTDRRIRHLPVMEEDRLLGMVSIGDLVKFRIGEIESEAEALKTYVHSGT